MEIASPLALWFLALIPPVILLYLLKMRRRPVPVSSTLLWEEVLSDLQANTPFQKLRANLQLILQLLIIILLTFGLANLLVPGAGGGGRTVVAIVDASASMASRDGSPTRLDQARAQLEQMIDAMSPSDELAVYVAAGGGIIDQIDFTSRTDELRQFARDLRATDASSGVREALLLAFAAVQRRAKTREPEVVLLSDGLVGALADLGSAPVPLRYLRCGSRGDNVGITRLSMRRVPGGEGSHRRHAVFVEVTNASLQPRQLFLSLGEGAAGGEIASALLTIPAGKAVHRTFQLEIAPGPIHLALQGQRAAHRDDLPADDRVVAFIPAPARVRVGLHGPVSPFVARALRTDELVELRNWRPGQLTDVLIASGELPDELPDVPTILFDPQGDLSAIGLERAPEIGRATVTRWNREHPLLRYLELADVALYKARPLRGPDALPLVWASARATQGGKVVESPVVVQLAGRRHPTLVVGFPLRYSNWVLRASFPFLLFNLVEETRRRDETRTRTARPGETLPIEVDGDGPLSIERPDGATHTLDGPGRLRYYHRTDRVGVYQWRAGALRGAFAINLLDRAESRTKPLVALDLGGKQVEDDSDAPPPKRPIWRLLALLALGFVLLEWWVFTRKIG